MESNKQLSTQASEVESRLRKMILDMEIGPGERLTERGLETQLGVSRTPIRAALLRLESEGLVRREGRGWMVTPLDLKEIEQLFVYRDVLESAALRLAAERLDGKALDALAAQLDAYDSGMPKEARHDINTAFHIGLAQLSGNEFVSRGVADAIMRLSRVRWLGTDLRHDDRDEHLAIVAALRSGEVERAVALVQAHIRESRERVLQMLQDGRRTLRARGVQVA